MKALRGVDYGIHALVSVIIQPSYSYFFKITMGHNSQNPDA